MDRQLLERMVGAAVLIVALVVIAPAILDGPGDQEPALPAPGALDREVRTVTIRPDREAAEPPVAVSNAGPEQPTAPAAVPQPKPQPESKPQAEPKPEVQPEPKAQPKPKSAAERKPTLAETRSGWAVQLGSFASRDNARRLAGEVSAKGYKTYLLPLQRDGRTLYRVRVGPRPSREAAQKLAGELAKAGYKGQVAPEGQAT